MKLHVWHQKADEIAITQLRTNEYHSFSDSIDKSLTCLNLKIHVWHQKADEIAITQLRQMRMDTFASQHRELSHFNQPCH